MNRYTLIEMLQQYAELWPAERDVVARIERLVTRHPSCFERTCRPGHITGAAWVVSSDRKKAVLVHHRKLNRWLQPGGHADGDADVANVAWREATEETGIGSLQLMTWQGKVVPLDIDIHEIPARYDADGQLIEDSHEHHDIRFLFVAGEEFCSGDGLSVSEESHALGWFSDEQIRDLTDEESVLRLVEKAMAWLA